jgi:hypothetical protein
MNKPHPSFSVAECKIRASILLKSLRKTQPTIKRKDALAMIAHEKGFVSWAELKCQLPFIRGGYLNHWFNDYAAAKTYQQKHGGYLLPYQKQYFICDTDYINHLGFDATDPHWQLIDYDWAQPADKTAWQVLYKQWAKIQGDNND